ncbi:gamma-taxilin [Pectinophora gossypiella]|nr:gamma-taxilin [Pectinophora gossypiella]
MEMCAEETPKEVTENMLPEGSSKEKSPASTPPSQEHQKKIKKDDKSSKKDDKQLEQFMKSLNSVTNVDEKLSLVCKKYMESTEEIKKMQFYIKQSDKRYAVVLKQKEHLQQEFNKTVLVKSKLENLCRELQKQNKAIKEESLLKIREEEERRKETQTKFQSTLSEITILLQQNNEKNVKLRDDNISMSEKFKSIVQQYQLREQQVDKMAKQMALESQLSDAKLQKSNLEHQAEKERLVAEMEQLKVTVAQYKAKVMELQGTESALKGQLAVYTDKYDEFQNALVKSNQVFGGFKEQMELMSKKIKKLEKESLSWKKKWETSQTALLDMCGERQTTEERVAATTRQLQHMQSLCRTLQAERTVLLNTLKENNIERPPLPAPTPAPPAPPPVQTQSDAKVDAMVANCAQLRQSLAHLQTQLNVLTTNKNDSKEEPSKPEKQKKSKSKKNKAEKQGQKVDTDTEKLDVKDNNIDELTASKETEDVDQQKTGDTEVPEEKNDAINYKTESPDNDEAESPEDKIDDQTMESLIQAINMANVDLCDLEVVNGEVNNKIDIVNDLAHALDDLQTGDSGLPLHDDNVEKESSKQEPENVSLIVETNPNEEVSHIAEVKPISNDKPE